MSANIDRLRAGRAAKAVEAAVERELAMTAEFSSINEMEDRTYQAYDRALRKACAVAHDDPDLWRRVAEAQQTAINTSNRRRTLSRHLGR